MDLDRPEHNLDRAAAYARAHGLALRPHVKTHKAPCVAVEQLQRGAAGLTCATPFEAEVMATVCKDLLVAYPPVATPRARRIAALPADVTVTVALDSLRAVEELHAAACAAGRPIGVLVELDLGMRRVGLADVAEAVELARAVLARPPLEWRGIAFYPGHI
ncbi:MAG: alanine racemase, partial [Gemmatimonadetes bacterium 21-71-4]